MIAWLRRWWRRRDARRAWGIDVERRRREMYTLPAARGRLPPRAERLTKTTIKERR